MAPEGPISDARTEVLESLAREAAKREAKSQIEAVRREAVLADAKVRAQEETMRMVHQKQADRAMKVSGQYSQTLHASLVPRPFFLQLNTGSKKGPGIYCMGQWRIQKIGKDGSTF